MALEPDHTEREETGARLSLAEAGLRRLDELSGLEAAPEAVLERLRRALHARRDHAQDRLGDDEGPYESADQVYRQLRHDLIDKETTELQRLYDDHRISDTTRRRLQRSLDLEEARLSDH